MSLLFVPNAAHLYPRGGKISPGYGLPESVCPNEAILDFQSGCWQDIDLESSSSASQAPDLLVCFTAKM